MSQTDLKQAAVQYLKSLQQAGLAELPTNASQSLHSLRFEPDSESETVAESEASREAAASPAQVVAEPAATYETDTPGQADRHFENRCLTAPWGADLNDEARIAALNVLEQQVSECSRCSELSQCRTQTVFGVGSPRPRLAFFGEGPGADEDRQGEPFVGRAGELLNKIIAACQMQRDEVYIFNTVKCRPPGNRNPQESEVANCWEYAATQLEILQPQFICCLGSVAARTLLDTRESVGRLRGRFHDYRGSQVMVTYHPAYLLRTPAAKAKTWDDMKMLMDAMGIAY